MKPTNSVEQLIVYIAQAKGLTSISSSLPYYTTGMDYASVDISQFLEGDLY